MRRAILEVRRAQRGGSKTVLAPGQKLRVGRTRADLIIDDDQMSAAHFELSWDGERGQLRDLKSSHGTLLGGQKVSAGEVRHGGWIRAGATDFLLRVEAATPPPLDFETSLLDAEEEEVSPLFAQWLRENRIPRREAAAKLAAHGDHAKRDLEAARDAGRVLYAVLDAARSARIRVLLDEAVDPCRSLYDGIEGEALAHVAPYLVELVRGSSLLERLVQEGWGKRWGVFFAHAKPARFEEVRRHLRRFLMVADTDTRKQLYFRFYDPGVLRAFLPTATPKQRTEFFGPITAFFAEGEHAELSRFDAEVR